MPWASRVPFVEFCEVLKVYVFLSSLYLFGSAKNWTQRAAIIDFDGPLDLAATCGRGRRERQRAGEENGGVSLSISNNCLRASSLGFGGSMGYRLFRRPQICYYLLVCSLVRVFVGLWVCGCVGLWVFVGLWGCGGLWVCGFL